MTRRFLFAVAIAAMASLHFELALTRLLSVTTWYHFAFAVISAAMLGLGLGSLLVTLAPRLFPRGAEREGFALAATLSSLATIAALAVALAIPVRLDLSARALATTALHAGAAVLPFAGVGTALALALRAGARRPGIVYAADLVGAGLGALAFLPVASWVGAPGAVLVAALALALAALLAGGARWRALAVTAAVLALAGLALDRTTTLTEIRWRKGPHRQRSAESYWNAYSYVTVTSPMASVPFGWGYGERPIVTPRVRQRYVQIDLIAGTVLTEFNGDRDRFSYLLRDVSAAGYLVRPEGRTLIIGVGGGRDVLTAHVAGSRDITGVEIDARLLDLVGRRFADETRLASLPGVRLVEDEARSYLARDPGGYDLIQASLIDTCAAQAAGAFALSENGIYTAQGWALFLSRLNPDGILAVSRFHEAYGRETLRVVSLAVAALARIGVTRPGPHLALLLAGNVSTILVRRSPFTAGELDILEAAAAALCFDVLYLPGRVAAAGYEPIDHGAAAWAAWARANPDEDLTAPGDDRPFFFYRTRPDVWLHPAALLTPPRSAAEVRIEHLDPRHVLLLALAGSALGALALLLLPAALGARLAPGSRPRPAAQAYMAMIGVAFMCVEVPLLTRFALVLGHPVLSLAVVLPGILVATGIGSLLGARLSARAEAWALALVPVLVAVIALRLDAIAAGIEPLPTAARVTASALVVLVAGLGLGLPLPAGLARAGGRDGTATPLLFALNGAFSVLGSVVAMIALLNAGARLTILGGAVGYAVSAVLFARFRGDDRALPANGHNGLQIGLSKVPGTRN